MSYTDTVTINGVSVRALPGIMAVEFIDGIYSPGLPRGDDDTIPGADGQTGAVLPVDKYLITARVTLQGATTAAMNDSIALLGPAVRGTTGLVTLGRVLAKTAGAATHTAPGRYAAGLSLGLVNWTTGQTDLQWYNLKGKWWDGSTWLIP